ncbi:sulfatase [Myxococcota bacterium]|nr:sulfatase [Myxococcota bacterium]
MSESRAELEKEFSTDDSGGSPRSDLIPRPSSWLLPTLSTLYFFLLAWLPKHVHYRLVDVALIVGCYALLSFAIYFATAFLLRLGRSWGLLGALSFGVAAAWQIREETDHLGNGLHLAFAIVAMTGLYWIASIRVGAQRITSGRSALLSMASVGLLIVLLVTSFSWSNSFRWHLLRHNRIFGTPAYHALAKPVPAVRQDLFRGDHIQPAKGQGVHLDTSNTQPPNIIFVLADTLRADALSAYGGDPSWMPETNAFAANSIVFSDVMANASWTKASMASMFTGLMPEEHGALDRGNRLPEAHHTLAEVLQDGGYETAAFVTNYAAVGSDAGFDQGFETFRELQSPEAYLRAEEVNEEVFEWLDERMNADEAARAKKPLFLYIHYLDPHLPYLSGGTRAPDNVTEGWQNYERELSYLDASIGSLTEQIREILPGETIIFFISDHGEEFGEHAESGHGGSLYPEVMHLPAVLQAPSLHSGAIDGRLEGRDFFDLLLRLARNEPLDLNQWVEERSSLRQGTRYASTYLTSPAGIHRPYQTHVCTQSVEAGDSLFIWSGYGDTVEFYDTRSDPELTRNLAHSKNDEIKMLRSRMRTLMPRWALLEPLSESDHTLEMLKALGYVDADEEAR